jgi:hypothetical protein
LLFAVQEGKNRFLCYIDLCVLDGFYEDGACFFDDAMVLSADGVEHDFLVFKVFGGNLEFFLAAYAFYFQQFVSPIYATLKLLVLHIFGHCQSFQELTCCFF